MRAVGISLSLLAGCLLLGSVPAKSEPHIAVRTGFKCGQCHVNKTGGGKRTEFGMIYAHTNLVMNRVRSSTSRGFVDGKIGSGLSMGADLRVDHVYKMETEGSSDTIAGSDQSRVTEANLYLEAALIPGIYTLYLDQTLSPAPENREFWGLYQNQSAAVYVKVGRMLLPYGLRLQNDDAFVRNKTGFTYNRHDLALEVGWEPGPWSVVANITDTRLSTIASIVYRRFRVGGSYSRDTKTSGKFLLGAFGGVNFGRVTCIGQGDFITESGVDRFAGLLELNFLLTQGFNVKASYEFFDRDRDVSNELDAQDRITLGVEPFITQFLQVSAFYRINRSIPQNAVENQNQITLQFHGFF